MPDFIGLSGYARSGKDTLASYLVREHGFTRVAFADALRDALYALNPIICDQWGDTRLQEIVDVVGWEDAKTGTFGAEVRALLQRLGTEVGRAQFGPTFWVDIAMKKANAVGGPVVFTDCRFPSEYDAVLAAGGKVWRVERAGCEPVNNHPSETALDGHEFSAIFYNDDAIEDLYRTVEHVLVRQS